MLGILYVALFLKEPQAVIVENLRSEEKLSPNQFKSNNTSENSEEKKNDKKSMKDKISDAITDVVFVLMRRRDDKGRVIIWLLLICNFIYIGCEYGKALYILLGLF